ncbi:hypothetical protein FHG87_001910 [Trinorchestia longiramus]|nr:hypothetical protein FHG87_001910 [Trinorchestia longiramus]
MLQYHMRRIKKITAFKQFLAVENIAADTAVARTAGNIAADTAIATAAENTAADTTIATAAENTAADTTIATAAENTAADATIATAADTTIATAAENTAADTTIATAAENTAADTTKATAADTTIATAADTTIGTAAVRAGEGRCPHHRNRVYLPRTALLGRVQCRTMSNQHELLKLWQPLYHHRQFQMQKADHAPNIAQKRDEFRSLVTDAQLQKAQSALQDEAWLKRSCNGRLLQQRSRSPRK